MNPFFLKLTSRNIHMCQGWLQYLWDENGSIPNKLYNLCVGRFESREWSDKDGKLECPEREGYAHYHLLI